MSTEQGEGSSTSQPAASSQHSDQKTEQTTSLTTSPSAHETPSQASGTPPRLGDEPHAAQTADISLYEEKKPAAKRDQPSESTSPSTLETSAAVRPRQVIAVSASKGPAAFFNLARKFLVTDEMCDLSALEGAIVSAVDAAHLLERSKLASIVRVQTSYVTVEPKRRKQAPSPQMQPQSQPSPAAAGAVGMLPPTAEGGHARRGAAGRELRRARIVITVKRTESYKRWLEENPLQAIIAGDGEDDEEDTAIPSEAPKPTPHGR